LANLSFLNPAGRSKAFDESAGGYGRGEGCGILILKRLDAAIADGDNIRAIIRATGANSDGYTQGGKTAMASHHFTMTEGADHLLCYSNDAIL
jgi:acyl transferase domain-containing protein